MLPKACISSRHVVCFCATVPKTGASTAHATSDVMLVVGSLDTVSGMGCVSYTAATASRRACRSST